MELDRVANLGIEVSQKIIASVSLRGECESSGDLEWAGILLASARETGFAGRKSFLFLSATLTVRGDWDFLAFRGELKQALNSMFRGPLAKDPHAFEEHDPEWKIEVLLRKSIEDVSQQRPDGSPDDVKTALPVEGDTFPVLEAVDELPPHTAATAEVEWSTQADDEPSCDPSLVDATGQDDQWTDEHIHGTIDHIPPSDIAEKPTQLTQAIAELQAGLAREREERRQEQMATARRIAALQDELRRVTRRLFREPQAFAGDAASPTPGGAAQVPVQLVRTFEERLDETEASLTEAAAKVAKLLENPVAPSPIRQDLPETQRVVLQAIADLPDDSFAEGERLIGTLEGQSMTESFSKSLASVMRKKKWGVSCGTCGSPATLSWVPSDRYAQGGLALYSHTGESGKTVSHSGLTEIVRSKFVSRPDRRRGAK